MCGKKWLLALLVALVAFRAPAHAEDSPQASPPSPEAVSGLSPEAASGGPIGLVREGDEIEINIPERRLELHVDEDELDRRRAAFKPLEPKVNASTPFFQPLRHRST